MNINELNKYDFISFDLFDTILKRNVSKPADIFNIVEIYYNKNNEDKISNFCSNRISAERTCRKESISEIVIEDIYEKITIIYGDIVANKLMQYEIEIELSFIQKNYNPEIVKIYDWAKKNKKVVLISDIYLSRDIMDKILRKNNITYDKLYLSSEFGKRKASSELFDYVLKDLNINPNQLFHIGDNENSDYRMPKKLEINAKLIPTIVNNLTHKRKKESQNINYNILSSFINNNVVAKEYTYFGRFGYECFGSILFGFSKWLLKRLEDNNIGNVFFLARDGKIMKDAFDIVNKNKKINSYYLMASRRSIIVPSLWKCSNMKDVFSRINIPSKITLCDLFMRLGLDDENLDDLLSFFNLNKNTKYDFNVLITEYQDFLEKLYDYVIANSKREYEALQRYLKKMNFFGNIAIVDIGWFGNMQLALTEISTADINGYYFGLRSDKKNGIKTEGYLFDKGKGLQLEKDEMALNSIFEFIFSASHGSVKRFVDNDEYFELYESENKDNYEMNALEQLQKGAIDFVNDFATNDISSIIELTEYDSCINIFEWLHYPSYEDSCKIGNIQFKDGELLYIANSSGIKKYILHPNKFVSDLNNSLWKIGFLKRTFKCRLPYKKIYKMLKRIK